MIVFMHPIVIDDADEPGALGRLDLDQVWDLMVHKAANPVSYVPSITRARVLERSASGEEFVREIVLRDSLTVRERVELQPKHRIVFHQLDNPDLATITNELGEDEQGRLTFTLTATLSAAGVERSRREPGFVAENELLFYDTAQATVNTIRLSLARLPVASGGNGVAAGL